MVDFLKVGKLFFYNVSHAVGIGQISSVEDVELVRFGYKMKRINPKSTQDQELNFLIDRMSFRGPKAPDVMAVIVQHQKAIGGPQDGYVSPAHNFRSDGTYDGKNMWIIEILSNNMRAMTSDVFPRIDLHPDCGPELARVVKFIFTNA